RKIAGHRRYDYRLNSKLLGDRHSMQGPSPAVGKECEVARIEAAHDRNLLDRGGHVGDADAQDALCHRHPVDQKSRRERIDGRCRRGTVEVYLTTEPFVGSQPAERDIAVRNGELTAAAAVAGGARHGSGRTRSDGEHAARADRRNAAAAGPNRIYIDLLEFDRKGADPAERGHAVAAVANDTDVSRGATHVIGDDISKAGCVSEKTCGDDPRRGT